MRRIFVLLAELKWKVAFLVILVMLSAAFNVVIPIISQHIVDRLIAYLGQGEAFPLSALLFASLGILASTFAGRAAKTTYDYHLFVAVTTVEDRLRDRVFEKYLRLSALFHHRVSSGQLIGRIERGAQGVYAILHDIIGQNLFPPLVIFASVLVVAVSKNPWIALVIFLPLPIYVIAARKATNRIYEIERAANDRFEAVTQHAYDVAGNVLTVKKFSQEHAETLTQQELQQEARDVQYQAERLWKLLQNLQTLIASIGRVGVLVLGGWFVINRMHTIGELVLFISLQELAYLPMGQLSVIFPRYRRNMARVERIFHILDEPERVRDKPEAVALAPLSHAVEFEHVSFRYGPERRWALRDMHITIPAGTTVALVGKSGSGKTTFINVLLRSYDPNEGAIRIDGTDIRDVTKASLLEQIAVVPQEVDLFSRTIAANIAYGKLDASRESIIEAATTALAHDFILAAEHGYDTVVGERGIRLSGGERQRVGIARAVLRDPKILILDEATSHLDTESERLIAEATASLIKNRTTFIIAHRLSTVIHADMILVFRGGRIEAVGTHRQLLKTSATYQKLYELQFGDKKRARVPVRRLRVSS